jgi:DNA-directed RNA polymerase subunit RPC12/RpoP
MIRYACPRCRGILESPDDKAGSKVACPRCQQRLRVPALPPNKTVLAPLVSYEPPAPPATIPLPPSSQAPAVPPPQAIPVDPQPPPLAASIPPPLAEPAATAPTPIPTRDVTAPSPRSASAQPDSSANRSPFGPIGVLLIVIGMCVVLYFWLIYDVTVPAPGSSPFESVFRVYNVGLMHNRLIGIMVGFGFAAVGIAFAFIGQKLQVPAVPPLPQKQAVPPAPDPFQPVRFPSVNELPPVDDPSSKPVERHKNLLRRISGGGLAVIAAGALLVIGLTVEIGRRPVGEEVASATGGMGALLLIVAVAIKFGGSAWAAPVTKDTAANPPPKRQPVSRSEMIATVVGCAAIVLLAFGLTVAFGGCGYHR